MSFYLVNATSLAKTNAVQLLGLDIKEHCVHMAVVTETWFTSKHDDNCLLIPNYTLYRRDRFKRKGGGVCAYIHNDIKCEVLPYDNCDDKIEILWLKCYFNCHVYYVACCYHPPNPYYESKLFLDAILNGIEQCFGGGIYNSGEYIILLGDFNTLDCSILETQCGLIQIVNQPTHGDNILDKAFTNRPDCFSARVNNSLLKTKHQAVLVSGTTSCTETKGKRAKVKLPDLRAHNIDYLRYMVAMHDWSMCFACSDVQCVYDVFLSDVHNLIDKCVPVKYVTVGPRDPSHVTPLIKSMLVKRNRLRKKGRLEEANRLAEKINIRIQDIRSRQYNNLAQASPKELWAAVKNTNGCVTQAPLPFDIFHDIESVNNFFASVCYDSLYSVTDVTCFKRLDLHNCSSDILLQPYEVERLLSSMNASSPGLDNIPHWFFRACSYEIADIVTHILNLSFDTGTVPKQWLNAIVTPVPKVAKPDSITEYRPISVTPLLSRLAEKLVVRRWLYPAITPGMLDDQFGFRPTGSTTCALISLLHHVTIMLERCSYVRCLMIDFSKAFDRVSHPILLSKLSKLELPDRAINWIISYLTGRTQVVKCNGSISLPASINTSIVQGSGIGPMLYAIMESDLHTLSVMNMLVKYADDTNLLVPSDSDVDLIEEFHFVQQWAEENRMVFNIAKTKEIVFKRPNPRLHIAPLPITDVQQVSTAKLLGVTLCEILRFDVHVGNVLKMCSQRVYLLKLLRDQGLPRPQLNIVFDALVLSRLRYAVHVWSGFMSVELKGQVNSFLKRVFKCGFCSKLHTIEAIADDADTDLFRKMANPLHCLHSLLPPVKSCNHDLRPKGHIYELPRCDSEMHKKSFVSRCLFKYL